MPDHLHVLLQPTITNISHVMHSIKKNSSRAINKLHNRGLQTSVMDGWRQSEASVMEGNGGGFQWQQSFYDHVIKDNRDFFHHIEYIRNNPVKAGLCTKPEEYPFLYVDEDAITTSLS